MKYGIVAFPSKKLQDLANTYRKRYDPHYAQITPHITLKDAFEADTSQINEISKKLSAIAAGRKGHALLFRIRTRLLYIL